MTLPYSYNAILDSSVTMEEQKKYLIITRIARYKTFKEFKSRIMVATDIFGRGIDIDHVNIVINYDMPDMSDSYLHRVGRAGRFGTKGLAISFIASEDDDRQLKSIQERFEVSIAPLPEQLDVSAYMNS